MLEVNAFDNNRETDVKPIRKRGLCEETTGLLHETRLGDSTQEEPGLGGGQGPRLSSVLSQPIPQVPSFCEYLLGTYFWSYTALDTEIHIEI